MGYINDENDFMHTKYSQSAKPAIGFKLTASGDYDMDKKKIFGLKTQDDVAFDADLDTYAKDLGSAVNKRYIDSKDALKADKTYADSTFLTKQTGGILAQSLQSKADKSYADDTFLTKKTGGVLAQKIQYVLDHTSESHVSPIDQKNVFDKIMTDQYNQLSEENDIELGDTIEHPNPVHQINKKMEE
ncbi:hypothetical protein ACROYT_G008514 [Oculina patagonica]